MGRLADEIAAANSRAVRGPSTPPEGDILRLALLSRDGSEGASSTPFARLDSPPLSARQLSHEGSDSQTPRSRIAMAGGAIAGAPVEPSYRPPAVGAAMRGGPASQYRPHGHDTQHGQASNPGELARPAQPPQLQAQQPAQQLPGQPAQPQPQASQPSQPLQPSQPSQPSTGAQRPVWMNVAKRLPENSRASIGAELRAPSNPDREPADAAAAAAAAAAREAPSAPSTGSRAQIGAAASSSPSAAQRPPLGAGAALSGVQREREELLKIRQQHEAQLADARGELERERKRMEILQARNLELGREVENRKAHAQEAEELRARLRQGELEAAEQESSLREHRDMLDAARRRTTSVREELEEAQAKLEQQGARARLLEAELMQERQRQDEARLAAASEER